MWPIVSVFILIVLLAVLFLTFLARGQIGGERLYIVYFEDGLWDIYLGGIFLLLAFAEWFEYTLIAIVPAILYPILLAAKQAITAPRLRADEVPPARDSRRGLTILLVLGVALLAAMFLLVTMDAMQVAGVMAWFDRYLLTVLWLSGSAFFVIWGYLSGVVRLVGYALLFATAWLANMWLGLPIYFYAIAIGAIICSVGVAVLIGFLRDHPQLQPR